MTERLDPLETAKQIEGSYKRYLKTLLAPRDEKLALAFDAEIDATTALIKGPILEMTPPYETGATCTADADCKTASTVCNTAVGRCVATSVTVDTGISCRNANGSAGTCATGQACSAASLRCTTTAAMTNTGKDCNMTACDAEKGEVCAGAVGKKTCFTPPMSICPAVTDVYVPDNEVYALSAGTLSITSGSMTRTAQPITLFTATRGDGAFSPVCRVRRYDSKALDTKLTNDPTTCTGREDAPFAARPRCTPAQIQRAGVLLPETELSFVNCVFPSL